MIKNKSISHAIDYILAHISEPIYVDQIAAHCHFSKHHFSRLFKAETGESVYEFIKRMRIERSAFRLKIESSKNITDIGGDYGYSASNYSSAFRQHYNMSPIAFRKHISEKSLNNPIYDKRLVAYETVDQVSAKITIKCLPGYFVIYERYKGSYRDLSEHWGTFLEKYKAYRTEESLLLDCTYDDPVITDINDCLYDLYMTVPEDCPLENTCVLKGGRFAVYHFKGALNQIYHSFQSLFNVWLPQSGHVVDERYGFDIYRKVDCLFSYIKSSTKKADEHALAATRNRFSDLQATRIATTNPASADIVFAVEDSIAGKIIIDSVM